MPDLEVALKPPTNEKGEVELYEPGEIPPYWQETLKRYGIRILQLAMTFGLVIPDYTMRDYIEHAIETPGGGYETIDIWGVQRSKKSCRTLILAHWVFDDWDTVIKEMVLMPDAHGLHGYENRGFLQKLQSIDKGKRTPFLAWDDVTVGMPSGTFKTDIEQYAAVDAAWAAIGTKITVMVLNNPLIDRLGRNIKDNITLEVYLGRNQVEQIERFVRLPGLRQVESNFFKIQVEPLHVFDWRYVPSDVFKQYFDLRLEIADFAIKKMGKAFKDEAAILSDMLNFRMIMNEHIIGPASLLNYMRAGFLAGEKIDGKFYVAKKDWEKFKQDLENTPDRRVGKRH
jgi:hypothetical protein